MLRKLLPFFITALLLAIAIAWDYFNRKSFNHQSLATQISKNIDHELSAIEAEVIKLNNDSLHLNWSSLQHSFYLIKNNKIIAWSKNEFLVGMPDLEGDYKLKLLQTSRMDLLLYQFPRGSRTLVGIVPLRVGYDIVNRYLNTTWNGKIFPAQGIKILAAKDSSGVAVCPSNSGCLFKIQAPQDTFIVNKVSLSAALLAIFVGLAGILLIVHDLHKQRRYFTAFILLSASLSGVRIAMVQFFVPGRWIYSEFFDPKYFASSSFNASVGDFFLNALIVAIVGVYLFNVYSRFHFIKRLARETKLVKWLIATLLLSASFFAFLFPHLFVESIFHDSAISIDIASGVALDGLRIIALGALALGCLSSFFFIHILLRWSKVLVKSRLQFIFFTTCCSDFIHGLFFVFGLRLLVFSFYRRDIFFHTLLLWLFQITFPHRLTYFFIFY